MFLYLLNNEEGKAFMELANIAKENNSDTVYDKAMFETYAAELNLREYKPVGLSLEAILNLFKNSKKQKRRIVVMEICGFLHSSKEYGPKVEEWVYSLANSLDIETVEAERLIRWSNDFSEFLGVGFMYINAK